MSRPQSAESLMTHVRGSDIRHPPHGHRRAGQSFDQWFLEGVLITAEIERDRILDAKHRQRTSQVFEPAGAYLNAAFYAELRTRKMIEPAALRVALGEDSWAMQAAIIATYCPEHFEVNLASLADQVALCRAAVQRQTDRISWAIRPLISDRAAGDRVIAAAENVGGPLPQRRILELCRHVATAGRTKRNAHAVQ